MKGRPWLWVNRRQKAGSYFRRLFPLLAGWRVSKLADLAVENWRHPERFK